MTMSSTSTYLLLFFYICATTKIVQCQTCDTNSPYLYSASIVCHNILNEFPHLPARVRITECRNCSIKIIDTNLMKKNPATRVQLFNLSNSNVEQIASSGFKSFSNDLRSLVFQNNHIHFIEPKAFSYFTWLEVIDLKHNNIAFLNEGVFNETIVRDLDLSYNQLGDVTFGFEGLTVSLLNVSHNEITRISEKSLDNITFLIGRSVHQHFYLKGYLDLSYNLISEISTNAFKSAQVTHLNLENNQITAIKNNTFLNLTKIIWLSFAGNQISNLYRDSFKGLAELGRLNLSRNHIENLPLGLFDDLKNLRILQISNNKLKVNSMHTFSGLINVWVLNLAFNDLQVIDQMLSPLGSLRTLDISSNKLQSLNVSELLDHHFRLQSLTINNNFWTCTDLFRMYKEISKKHGGFHNPAQYYYVPNLHGIACSKRKLRSYEGMTFEKFLDWISKNDTFEDTFDLKFNEQAQLQDEVPREFIIILKNIRAIFCMMTVVAVLVGIIFLQFVVRNVSRSLYKYRILSSDKFSFMHAKN